MAQHEQKKPGGGGRTGEKNGKTHDQTVAITDGTTRDFETAIDRLQHVEGGGLDCPPSEVDLFACKRIEREVILKDAFVADAGQVSTGRLDFEVVSDCGPVVSATIVINSQRTGRCRTTVTDAHGRACFDGVPEGEVEGYKITAAGYSGFELHSLRVNNELAYHCETHQKGSKDPHVTAGGSSLIRLKAKAQRAKVAGHVYFRRDRFTLQPIEGVIVTAVRNGKPRGSKTTRADGWFEFDNVCPGVLALNAPAEVRRGQTVLRQTRAGVAYVQVDPGSNEACDVIFEYIAAPGELRLLATLCEPPGCCDTPADPHPPGDHHADPGGGIYTDPGPVYPGGGYTDPGDGVSTDPGRIHWDPPETKPPLWDPEGPVTLPETTPVGTIANVARVQQYAASYRPGQTGWQPRSQPWIRKGDALWDTVFRITTDAPTPSFIAEARMTGAAPAIIRNLPGGTYQVTAYPRNQRLRPIGSSTARITVCDGQIVTVDDFCFYDPDPTAYVRVFGPDGNPLKDARVTLTDVRRIGPPIQGTTDCSGGASFNIRRDRQYQVGVEHTISGDSVLAPTGAGAILGGFGGTTILEHEVHMAQDDQNIVIGEVLRADGTPAANVAGRLYNCRNQLIAEMRTDARGRVRQPVEEKGWYHAIFTDGLETTEVDVEVRSPGYFSGVLGPGGGGAGRFVRSARAAGGVGGGGGPATFADVPESIVDLSAYPVLTEEIGFPNAPSAPSGPGSVPGAAPGISPIGAIASTAIREVLGWKTRNDDPKGFIGALTQSFELTEFEGHVESKWTPRTYAVQTDLAGGVTGAQASIYARAQDSIDDAVPLLEGLYPLRDDADEQDMQALKAIVKSQVNELVNELGIAGGPRLTRVDQIFSLLLGPTVAFEPDIVAGQLGTLREEMGLWSIAANAQGGKLLINTVDEEQNVTNYRILVDYLTSLRQSWINSKPFFGRTTSTPFFGTQLVLLSRQLSVIAESVGEVRFALDSVFIGPAERQTIELQFPGAIVLPANPRRGTVVPPNSQAGVLINSTATNTAALLVEELLTWVYHFAAEEGPRLIQDGGKFAVGNSVLPVVVQLRNLVFGAIAGRRTVAGVPSALPRGYFTLRVQRALQELASQLDELALLAAPISHTIPSQT